MLWHHYSQILETEYTRPSWTWSLTIFFFSLYKCMCPNFWSYFLMICSRSSTDTYNTASVTFIQINWSELCHSWTSEFFVLFDVLFLSCELVCGGIYKNQFGLVEPPLQTPANTLCYFLLSPFNAKSINATFISFSMNLNNNNETRSKRSIIWCGDTYLEVCSYEI